MIEDWSPGQSHHSPSPVSEEGEIREADLSEEEGAAPNKPASVGLFPPALFKTLLGKAKAASDLGGQMDAPTTPAPATSASAWFTEHKLEAHTIHSCSWTRTRGSGLHLHQAWHPPPMTGTSTT